MSVNVNLANYLAGEVMETIGEHTTFSFLNHYNLQPHSKYFLLHHRFV